MLWAHSSSRRGFLWRPCLSRSCVHPQRRHDHGDLLAISPVLLSVKGYQVGLFEPDRHQDVGGRHGGKEEMGYGHDRRRPKRQQPPEVKWVPHVAIEERCAKLQMGGLPAGHVEEDLAKSEQVKVNDPEGS